MTNTASLLELHFHSQKIPKREVGEAKKEVGEWEETVLIHSTAYCLNH